VRYELNVFLFTTTRYVGYTLANTLKLRLNIKRN